MKTGDAIGWFKTKFGTELEKAVAGTPFSVDMLTAIAYQETGYIWSVLVDKQLSLQKILQLCVGDTIDAPSRSEFPKSKAQLVAAPRGEEMFRIARQALVDMAQYIPGYSAMVRNADKFCHGYGIFQYDLQFFKDDPAFFLEKKWCDLAACVAKFIVELREAMRRQGWPAKSALTDPEKVYVAIAYNQGSADLKRGFKQGHKSDDGRYYGENVCEYLGIAQTICFGAPAEITAPPRRTAAPLPPPTPVEATDDVYEVDVRESTLHLRSEPKIDKPNPRANVIAQLPAGQMVVRISGKEGDEFFEVETSLNGAHFRGFAAAAYLRPVKVPKAIPVVVPAAAPPTDGIVAVYMPRKAGTITRRADPAGPQSLNEPGQPQRNAESAAERCAQLAAIIDWLAVDKPAHKRYQPTGGGTTFCNIYAHDYCFLANVYLPRVWWTPGAIEQLAKGETVEPLYEKTIDEQRANNLFRWLCDFGPRFGWRQTGTLTKLQDAANLGGICIIVAQRKIDGKSGHIVAIVPETDDQKTKRDSDGSVIGPLQSQAGVTNFRYRATTAQWWKGKQFADSAFWIHA
ncbi:MAG: hypothetical protein DME61_05390 [Verrucomicrobia bacterium]|nr:MAG: hypothetical protein DME61_05390 [Verrucomicrobiota bacterium]PYL67817.1 MAG: hypothetical protein DMF28_08225 [Verrucomicrobiota bacterium]